jgi:ATP-dependent Lon protease
MTGEITLTGLVLPVGGIREKVLAARRAGLTSIMLPKRNQADVEEIQPEYREGLTFHWVERIDDVWKQSLLAAEECGRTAASAAPPVVAPAATPSPA